MEATSHVVIIITWSSQHQQSVHGTIRLVLELIVPNHQLPVPWTLFSNSSFAASVVISKAARRAPPPQIETNQSNDTQLPGSWSSQESSLRTQKKTMANSVIPILVISR